MRTARLLPVSALLLTCLLLPAAAQAAATLTIVNADLGTGKGLDDRTPVAAVGGNPATTLGGQRLAALQKAADLWGEALADKVEILIRASFMPMDCEASSAFLGAAGPTVVEANFPNAPLADTWYPVALASKLAGSDLDPPAPAGLEGDDVVAVFNSSIGKSTCLGGVNWYYGFDKKAPGKDIDFVSVAMHEFAHGLGFLSFVDVETGLNLGPNRFNDLWNHFLFDAKSGKNWNDLTPEQRHASAVDTGNLTWSGQWLTAHSRELTGALATNGMVKMYAPSRLEPGSSVSHFDLGSGPLAMGEPGLGAPSHSTRAMVPLLEDLGWTTSSCGKGVAVDNQLCNVADLRGKTCGDVPGFTIGTLACNSTCDNYDLRQCFPLHLNTPITDLKDANLAPQLYMIHHLTGGYEFHPDMIVEANKIANENPAVKAARRGPVTGFYYTNPALTAQESLQWAIGIPLKPGTKADVLAGLNGYQLETIPAMRVVKLPSAVSKAPFDGMRIILWMKLHGYRQIDTLPVRMEFHNPPGQPDVMEMPASGANLDASTVILTPIERDER